MNVNAFDDKRSNVVLVLCAGMVLTMDRIMMKGVKPSTTSVVRPHVNTFGSLRDSADPIFLGFGMSGNIQRSSSVTAGLVGRGIGCSGRLRLFVGDDWFVR
jgi:hypothetical protein